jgi:hypothetical protein
LRTKGTAVAPKRNTARCSLKQKGQRPSTLLPKSPFANSISRKSQRRRPASAQAFPSKGFLTSISLIIHYPGERQPPHSSIPHCRRGGLPGCSTILSGTKPSPRTCGCFSHSPACRLSKSKPSQDPSRLCYKRRAEPRPTATAF